MLRGVNECGIEGDVTAGLPSYNKGPQTQD